MVATFSGSIMKIEFASEFREHFRIGGSLVTSSFIEAKGTLIFYIHVQIECFYTLHVCQYIYRLRIGVRNKKTVVGITSQ